MSALMEGDVVTAIHGTPIIDAPKQTIDALLSSQVDEVFVSVLSSNVIRAMHSRVDMHQVLAVTKPIEIAYSNPGVGEIAVRLVTYYDLKSKTNMKAHVLFYAPLELNCGMFVGDVILAISGMSAMQLTAEDLQQ